MRLYIIRHADPDYPNNTITPAGHLEAEALARRFARMGVDKIYSSPLGRAIDTMTYTARLLGMEGSIEEWTAELSLPHAQTERWGKISVWDVPGEILRGGEDLPTHKDWHRMALLDDPTIRAKIEEVRRYSDDFLNRHGFRREGGRYRCVAPNRERVAVFCHGAFGLAWIAHLLELPLPLVWSGFWLAPSSVTTILMEQRSAEWAVPRCLGLGDVSHLYEAGLPVSPSGTYALNW